jgi:hypothetical protein
MTEDYVIWSLEHRAWWQAASFGYCATLTEAGRYSEQEAATLVREHNVIVVREVMIPVRALAGGDVLVIQAKDPRR